MAYRHSLTTSARLFDGRRFAPSFSSTRHEDDRKNSHSDEKVKSFLQSRPGFGGMSSPDPKQFDFLHALCCRLIISNCFFLLYHDILKKPFVKMLRNIPLPSPTTTSSTLAEVWKKKCNQDKDKQSPPSPTKV